MTILESTPEQDQILDFIDEGVRHQQEGGLEPRFILLGQVAYERLCNAIADRFGKNAGSFEQYQYLTIIVDPLRNDQVVVLPAPGVVAEQISVEP